MLKRGVFYVVILSLAAGLCQGADTVEELSGDNADSIHVQTSFIYTF